MPVAYLPADYDGTAGSNGSKDDTGISLSIGATKVASFRSFIRFDLTSLPYNAKIESVKLIVYCSIGRAGHLLDVHGYDVDGSSDPAGDDGLTCYSKCASGHLYADDLTVLQSAGEKVILLSGEVNRDLLNAKALHNYFTVGLHEEGDDCVAALLDSIEFGYVSQLEVVYSLVEAAVFSPFLLFG